MKLLRLVLNIWMGLFYRAKVTGAENVPMESGAVLCSNHIYKKDLLLLGFRLKRRVRWLAKSELFENKAIGRFLAYLGAFPVKRGKSDRDAVKKIYGLLADGEVVGIFPEGTRIVDRAARPEAKRGFVTFALKAKVPIVPAAVAYGPSPIGWGQVFSKVKVVFFEPFEFDFDKQYSNSELDAIGKQIMEGIYTEVDGFMGDK